MLLQLNDGQDRYKFLRDNLIRGLDALEKEYPTLFWVPNVAQERVIRVWEKEPYPFLMLCTFANGTGKTNCCVQDMAATLLGPKYCNTDWMNLPYYKSLKKLRDTGKLRTRIVCDAEDVRENGSMWSEIMDWLPGAKFSGKTSSATFKQLQVPHPDIKGVTNYVDIKTFDQKARAHAGANLHRIWMNEPPPEDVFSETVGRTRSKAGDVSTYILIFATVLDEAGYLFDYLEDKDFASRVVHLEGSTWENCCGDQIPDEVAVRLHLKPDGNGGYVTRGVLTRDSIENMISAWRKKPGEIEARLWGKPMHLGGAIWKTFNEDVHVVNDYPLPPKYPVVQVVDPHPAHDDLSAWYYASPNGRLVWFMEWPSDQWELMHGRRYTISETCEIWREMEAKAGVANRIARVGDPNMFRDPDPNTLMLLHQKYAAHGFVFNINVSDNLEVGHRSVSEMLYYDAMARGQSEEDPLGKPRMYFFASLRNLTTAAKRYGFRTTADGSLSSRVSQKYKGGADLIRLGCMYAPAIANQGYQGSQEQISDYERVKRSRLGGKYRDKRTTIKGRRVIARGFWA